MSDSSESELKSLLFNLKSILEVLLNQKLRTIQHDPLRLYLCIQKIITHEIKFTDTWPFADATTTPTLKVDHKLTAQIRRDKRLMWICDRIERNLLGENIRMLVGDKEFLLNIYNEQAFLRQEKYVDALLICLCALERQQINLLSQIDQCLYTILTSRLETSHRTHKRSNSHPHFTLENQPPPKCSSSKRSITNHRKLLECQEKQIINLNLRPWSSLPNIAGCVQLTRSRSKTICVQRTKSHEPVPDPMKMLRELPKVPSFKYTPTPVNSSSNLLPSPSPRPTINYDEIEIHFDRAHTPKHEKKSPAITPRRISTTSSKKLINFIIGFDPEEEPRGGDDSKIFSTSPAGFIPEIIVKEGEKLPKSPRANFLDDLSGHCSRTVMPKPFSGQSLTDFLKRIQSSANKNADLDRENAHLIVSEAIIGAVEQLKCSQMENVKGRNQTSQAMVSSSSSFLGQKSSVESGVSASSYGSPACYGSVSDTEIEVPEEIIRLPSQQEAVEAGLVAAIEWEDTDDLSAEGVALSLLSKFNDKQLPCASEIMMWMVSEKDAPQQILPMPPNTYHIANPDEYSDSNTMFRGTRDWAPPRQQIIFTRHPQIERKKLLAQQNNRCAGCGMKVAPMYSSRFRYCDYLGKYQCSGCHKNQKSQIPARILENWDFQLYPVSVFAYRLIDSMWLYPLFRVCDLNAMLYTKINSLRLGRERRKQLKYVKDLIMSCRFAKSIAATLNAVPAHWTGDDIEIWSMSDFVAIKTGTFNKDLLELVKQCADHAIKCDLCLARGFICELCIKKDTIFPWQPKVKRCDKCGTCYHEKCWLTNVTGKCNKCERLRKRQTGPATPDQSAL